MVKSLLSGFFSFLGLCFILTFNSCGIPASDNAVTIPPSSALSFFHASPNDQGLDIFIDSAPINAGTFEFKSFTGYLQVTPPGLKKVKFSVTASLTIQIDTSFTLVQSKSYTIVVANKSSGTPQALLMETSGALTSQSNTAIRFVHLSPDTPAVSVNLIEAGVPLVTGQTYTQGTAFQEFPTKNYTVEVRRYSDNKLLITVPLTIVLPGTFQTIYFVGYSTPPGGNLNSLSYKIVN